MTEAQVEVVLTALDEIRDLRNLYLRELDDVVRYEREIQQGQTRIFVLRSGGRTLGYGILHGEGEDRSTIVEFFLLPEFRQGRVELFKQFAEATGATGVQARTNDTGLLLLLYECTQDIVPGQYYFVDAETTHYAAPDVRYRPITLDDLDMLTPIMTSDQGWPFEVPDRAALAHWIETRKGRMLEGDGGVTAIGAILTNYNPPFATLGMVVMRHCRRRGYGTYLLQELKRETYAIAKIPRADCAVWNTASRATLLRAGFDIHARALRGDLIDPA